MGGQTKNGVNDTPWLLWKGLLPQRRSPAGLCSLTLPAVLPWPAVPVPEASLARQVSEFVPAALGAEPQTGGEMVRGAGAPGEPEASPFLRVHILSQKHVPWLASWNPLS